MRMFGSRVAISVVVLAVFSIGMMPQPCADAGVQSGKSQKPHFTPQKRGKPSLRRAGKGYKIKKGAEVAAKVRKLKQSDKNVRAALKLFEDKKRMPKIDEAFAVAGSLGTLNAELTGDDVRFLKASFLQSSLLRGTEVDMIFVPVLSDYMEWQGSIIANLYDSSSYLVGQYVAESVLIMPDPNLYAWDEVYEAPVYNGVVLGAISEPGMYTHVDLGIPLSQQQISREMVRTNLAGSNLAIPVSYSQGGPAPIRAWANCAFGWCGGASMNCVGTALWSADVLGSSCFASGCGDYAIGCTWGTIWQ